MLMYHHVTDLPVDAPSTCVCTVKDFIHSLEDLEGNGYHFIPIENIEEAVRSHTTRFAVVTFDDVPESALKNAVPYLKKEKIPYTFFVGVDFLKREGFISEEQLKELAEDPLCTVGSHSYSHSSLRHSGSLERELKQSKKYLEVLLGREVEYVAYPYGTLASVSGRVQRYARECGYLMAFGTLSATITDISFKKKFFLPRMVINNLHL